MQTGNKNKCRRNDGKNEKLHFSKLHSLEKDIRI